MSLFGVIRDAITGVTAKVTNGGLDVNIQDQHTRTGDLPFGQIVGGAETLAVAGVEHEYTITLTGGHAVVVGSHIVMSDSVSERVYIGSVLVVATNLITLDTPLNFAYPTATTAIVRYTEIGRAHV